MPLLSAKSSSDFFLEFDTIAVWIPLEIADARLEIFGRSILLTLIE